MVFDSAECLACQATTTIGAATEAICVTRRKACLDATDAAMAGPGAGMGKGALCRQTVACYYDNTCTVAGQDPLGDKCFCGEGVDSQTECLTPAAKGTCLPQLRSSAETMDNGQIAERLGDPTYAAGRALSLLQCLDRFCAKSCGRCDPSAPTCVDMPPAMVTP